MLDQCHAYVVGRDEEHDHSLMQTAGTLGFISVSGLFRKGTPRVDVRRFFPCLFVLVHYRLEDEVLRSVIATVRSSENEQIRFAPLVMLLDDGPYELVLRYVRLGFDDVIALPERRELVASRLCGQLGQEITYFGTSGYFGPDRRRMERPVDTSDERRADRHPYTRYTIIRSADRGVRVLRQENYRGRSDTPSLAAGMPQDARAGELRHS
jgi:hypothetical protein